MSWDPQQYARFAGQRLRPALDLLARIPLEQPQTVVDLGCGTGNVTRILRSRWPQARMIGVDGSPQPRAAFEAEYRRRVAEAYPQRSDGKTLFPFRRLFIVALIG